MLDGPTAGRKLKEILEADPPYGAKVTFNFGQAATGWHAPPTAPWLARAIDAASLAHFGKEAMWMGEGGTIPFMAMLGAKFPVAQFLITGVLGPHANAHGPNEFLHLPTAQKLTCCVADTIRRHALRPDKN
jgi:acetylornithine deacetylase/succinyl-diaminopimelate desuccinylase-like protein